MLICSKKCSFIINLFTLIIFMISATACQTNPNDPTQILDSANNNFDEHIVITFAAPTQSHTYIDPFLVEFNRLHPDITVQFVESSTDDVQRQAAAADTTILSGTEESSRYFLNLSPLIEADSDFQPDDFWPGILKACQSLSGSQVGIPFEVTSPMGIFFDAAAFDKAGRRGLLPVGHGMISKRPFRLWPKRLDTLVIVW